MADNSAVTTLVFDASGAKKGAADFQAAGQQIITANQAVETSETRLAATTKAARSAASDAAKQAANDIGGGAGLIASATDRVVVSLQKQAQILSRVQAAVDPLGAALQRAGKNVDDLNKVIAAGGPNAEKALGLLGAAQQKVADLMKSGTGAANDNAGALGKAGQAAKTAADAHATLSAQGQAALHSLRSLAEQAALGVSPLQALTQQLGHLSYAASGPGGLSGALGEALGVIRGLIGGAAAPIAALGALAGAVYLIGSRALAIEDNLKSFGNILRTMGTDSLLSAQQAETFLEKLRDLGESADTAKAALKEVFATPGINPAAGGDITTLAHNLAQSFGGDTLSRTKELDTAITGGVEALIKFGAQFNLLTTDEIGNLRISGNVADAFNLIKSRIPTPQLSEFQTAAIKLKAAWNDAVDALAKSDFAKGAVGALSDLATGIGGVIDKLDTWYNWIREHQDFLGKAIDQITGGGLANQLSSSAATPTTNSAAAARQDLVDALRERGASPGDIAGVTGQGQQLATGGLLPAIVQSLIRTESRGNPNAVSSAGAIGLTQLMPGTAAELGVDPWDPAQNVAGGSRYLVQLTQQFGNLRSGLQAYNWGPGNFQQYLAGNKSLPGSVANYADEIIGRVPGATGNETATQLTTGTSLQAAEIEKVALGYSRALTAAQKFGVEQQVEEARLRALAEAESKYSTEEDKVQYILDAVANARDLANAEAQKSATLAELETQGTLKTADAYQASEAAGLKEAAMQQARLANLETGVPVQQKYTELLTAGAAAAIGAAQQQTTAYNQTLAASARLVDAAKNGTAAEHDAEIQNEAVARTHDALTKAIATGNQGLIERAQKLQDETAAQLKANDAMQQTLALERGVNDLKDQGAQLQLQAGLQNLTPAEQQRQLDLLRAQQYIANSAPNASPEEKAAYLSAVDAIGQQRVQLEAVQAQWGRINDAVRNVADTVESTLTQAISDAFDGKKAESWGDRLKAIFKSLAVSLADALVIKPAIGTVLGTLGASPCGNSFGDFAGVRI